MFVQKDDGFFIEDQGSLNGTSLNRHRIESGQLETATSSRSASTS